MSEKYALKNSQSARINFDEAIYEIVFAALHSCEPSDAMLISVEDIFDQIPDSDDEEEAKARFVAEFNKQYNEMFN